MEGTLEELRRISNCPEGATFSQLGLRKSVGRYSPLPAAPPNLIQHPAAYSDRLARARAYWSNVRVLEGQCDESALRQLSIYC